MAASKKRYERFWKVRGGIFWSEFHKNRQAIGQRTGGAPRHELDWSLRAAPSDFAANIQCGRRHRTCPAWVRPQFGFRISDHAWPRNQGLPRQKCSPERASVACALRRDGARSRGSQRSPNDGSGFSALLTGPPKRLEEPNQLRRSGFGSRYMARNRAADPGHLLRA